MKCMEYFNMTQKVSNKTVDLDNTKITSLIHYRSGEMSDATRLLRKQQFLKKKLKSVLDVNANLQKEIKINEGEIKDERSGISFQLTDLLKELSIKFQLFTEEQLERARFKTNQVSHNTIQTMMQKYQKIEEESHLLKKICESLDSIQARYEAHSKEMEQLVISLEQTNKEYEETMENSLNDINEEIKKKMLTNQQIDTATQSLVKEIDGFVEGVALFKEEQNKLVGKIERLKKMAMKQQQKVNEIQEWAQIIIDKNNRQAVYKTLSQKEQDLMKLKINNNHLQIYLNELLAEQKLLTSHKQNTMRPKSTKSSIKHKSSVACISRMI